MNLFYCSSSDHWIFHIVDQTWELAPSEWGSPPPRRYAAASVATDDKSYVVFGGSGYLKLYNDLWLFSHQPVSAWTLLSPDTPGGGTCVKRIERQ